MFTKGGIVDQRYLEKAPQTPYFVGGRLALHTHETVKDYVFLHDVAVDFDVGQREPREQADCANAPPPTGL